MNVKNTENFDEKLISRPIFRSNIRFTIPNWQLKGKNKVLRTGKRAFSLYPETELSFTLFLTFLLRVLFIVEFLPAIGSFLPFSTGRKGIDHVKKALARVSYS